TMNVTSLETAVAPAVCLPKELIRSTVFLMGRIGITVKMEAVEEFEQAGFSPYDYGVLALLDEGARETQATIADTLAIDRSQLVGLLDGLEERELIERRRDPNDRRRQMVSTTAAGRKELARLRKMVKRIEDEFLAPLSVEERATLHGLLLRVAEHRDQRYVVAR
ncbi:MAG TPA: MarR family winged helix-turn-helix transcriptional regulator, partial [Gaiellaceae bacterium]|nr:MarR family winged helix-turn-helix transcriptional regulator [Gaiellaceae bacterium]